MISDPGLGPNFLLPVWGGLLLFPRQGLVHLRPPATNPRPAPLGTVAFSGHPEYRVEVKPEGRDCGSG